MGGGAGEARLCFRGGRGVEYQAGFVSERQESQGTCQDCERQRAGAAAESGRLHGSHKGGVLPPREICLTSGKYRLQ